MDLISLLAKPVGRFAYYRVMLEVLLLCAKKAFRSLTHFVSQRFLSYVNPEERIYEPGMELQSQLTRLLSRLSAPTEKEDAQRFQMMDLQTQKKSGPFVVRHSWNASLFRIIFVRCSFANSAPLQRTSSSRADNLSIRAE